MLAESDSRTPMVCLLSMGSDPTENIERLAKNKVTTRVTDEKFKGWLGVMRRSRRDDDGVDVAAGFWQMMMK